MEKENTTKTGGEGKESFNWEGCQCGCGDNTAQEEKSKSFMDCGSSMCMPEDMSKMWKGCCSGMSMPEKMEKMMKGFRQPENPKA